MDNPCRNVLLGSDLSEEVIKLEMNNSYKSQKDYAEPQTKVLYDSDNKKVKTDDPKNVNIDIDEHKLSYIKLEIVKSEDVDSGFTSVNSSSKTDCPNEDSNKISVNFDDCKNKVDCEDEQIEYKTTERVPVSGNDNEEESIDRRNVIKIEMCTPNSIPNSKDTIQSSDRTDVSGFEKGNIDDPHAFGMDVEHKLSYKWLQVGKIEDVKEEVNMDRPLGKVNIDRQYSEQITVKLNGFLCEVDFADKETEYDAIQLIKFDSDIKEEKTEPEDVIMDMEEFAKDGTASGENLKPTNVSCEDNIEFPNSVQWHYCKFCGYRTKFEDRMKKHLENEYENGTNYYYCHHCGFKTHNKKYLKIHFRLKHNDSSEWYKCQYCAFKTKIKSNLKQHFRQKHDDSAEWYECQHCEFKTKRRDYLNKHFKKKHDDSVEWYKCQYCEFKRKDKRSLVSHLECKHDIVSAEGKLHFAFFTNDVKLHQCQFCDYRCKFKNALQRHAKNKHDQNIEWHHCQYCEFKTKDKRSLTSHLELKHEIVSGEGKFHQCQFCDYRCKIKYALQRHVKNKHAQNIEWHQCQYCEFKTKDKRYLASHLEIKHEIISDEGKLHQCQFCDYRCKIKYALQRHVKNKHAQNIEWHYCQYCEYKTGRKSHLTSHFKYKHSQIVEWYQCCYCEFKTNNKSHLTSHFKYKHSQNAEWYHCPHCELKTKRKTSLHKHLEGKHGIISGEGKLQQCQFCDYKCKFISILRQHLKNKHSKNVE